MNSGGSNNLSLKYERYASSGCWDIIKLGFVAKLNSFGPDSAVLTIIGYKQTRKVYTYIEGSESL